MWKRVLLAALAVVAVALGALAWTFRASDLEVGASAPPTLPPPVRTASVTVWALPSGQAEARQGLAYRGGELGQVIPLEMAAVLLRHPKGDLVFDAGLGKNLEAHLETLPAIARRAMRVTRERTVAEQLQRAGIVPAGIVLTHAHWDHVSGVEDLPGVPVWVTQAERDFVDSGAEITALARHIGTRDYRTLTFGSGPYLGFSESHDFFGDGTVVLVPAPGHTPGSVIAFLSPSDGSRYALLGDIAWQREGIEHPAERPWLSRQLADADAAGVRGLLVRLHQLARAVPELVMVPAHDRRVLERLPRLP
jgi:N-acyl homoserine lactone hydrolase